MLQELKICISENVISLTDHSTFPVVCQRNCNLINDLSLTVFKPCHGKNVLTPFFWDVTLCRLANSSRIFEGRQCLDLPVCLVLKMRVLQSFETSGSTYPTPECHIPEEWSLEQHLCEIFGACSSCHLFPKFIFVLLKIKRISTCIHLFCSFTEG